MAIPDGKKVYPRAGDNTIVYLKNVVKDPNIEVGDFTFYNDFVNDPRDFEKNNVLYHYPINHDRLRIGKFCSIACGAKFLFNSARAYGARLGAYGQDRKDKKGQRKIYGQADRYPAVPFARTSRRRTRRYRRISAALCL